MNVLLIGFGSIGRRHYDILKSLSGVSLIHLVTKQDIESARCFSSLSDVECLDVYDYFIVASETAKHYEQLQYICSQVIGKKVLVEKPLYSQRCEPFDLNGNSVYVGYNLRFHPVLQRLQQLLENQEVYYANIMCGQYLPTWRPQQDYRKSYSADIKRGGGVLRDLSHELDYMQWLFGELDKIHSLSFKRSDLEIHSDDIFTAVGVTKAKVVVNITLDYISKHPIRKLIIHAQDITIETDVIKGCITVSNKEGEIQEEQVKAIDRDYTYSQMHEAILGNEVADVCSFEEGLEVVSVIDGIHFEELE